LVPAGEGRGGKRALGRTNIVLLRLAPEARRDGVTSEAAQAVEGLLVLVSEDRALPPREGDDEPHPLAVLRHVAEPEPAHPPGRVGGGGLSPASGSGRTSPAGCPPASRGAPIGRCRRRRRSPRSRRAGPRS